MNRMMVYQIDHRRHDDETGENTKNCGFFSSKEGCSQAIAQLIKQPGFCDYTNDFNILEFPLDIIVSPDRFLAKGNVMLGDAEVDSEKLHYMWHAQADDEYLDFAVIIGVFSSEDQCRRAIDLLADEPEFRDHRAGFGFEQVSLGWVGWSEGFFSEPESVEGAMDLPWQLLKQNT